MGLKKKKKNPENNREAGGAESSAEEHGAVCGRRERVRGGVHHQTEDPTGTLPPACVRSRVRACDCGRLCFNLNVLFSQGRWEYLVKWKGWSQK